MSKKTSRINCTIVIFKFPPILISTETISCIKFGQWTVLPLRVKPLIPANRKLPVECLIFVGASDLWSKRSKTLGQLGYWVFFMWNVFSVFFSIRENPRISALYLKRVSLIKIIFFFPLIKKIFSSEKGYSL